MDCDGPGSAAHRYAQEALRAAPHPGHGGSPGMSALSSAPVRIVVMEGDGIGPEITAATMRVVRAADDLFKLGLSFAPVSIGLAALRAHGTTLPETAVEAAKAADGVILGPVSHNDYPPVAQGGLNPSGELRKRRDLFANIRPARSRPGFPPRCAAAAQARDCRAQGERAARLRRILSRLRARGREALPGHSLRGAHHGR